MYKQQINLKKIMEPKTKAIQKVILSRRALATSKLMEESKLCSVALLQLQAKQLQILQQLHFLHTAKISLAFERSCYEKAETQSFWEKDCKVAEESIFRQTFRMSRNLFNKLCELLSDVQHSFTNLSERITLQKGVAIALYALGSTENYRKVGKLFGVKEKTVIKIILRFCQQVWKFLAPKYLNYFPLKQKTVETLMEGFEALGFPQCIGALDSCRFAIKPPSDNFEKNSVILLTLVDARCRFIYVNCGSPGHCIDSQVYQESSLRQYLDQCNLLLELQKNISDVDVPVLIIGDSAFQLSEKLMTPYSAKTLQTQQQKLFNHVLSKSLTMAKYAILQLKARFRRIGKAIDNDKIGNANAVILTCCVLHNFLNENNDVVNEDWLQDLQTEEPKHSYTEQNSLPVHSNNNSPKAIRLAIASYLAGKDISDDNEYEDLDDQSEFGGFKEDDETGDSIIDRNDKVFTPCDNIIIDEWMSE